MPDKNYKKLATDPKQYDSAELNWEAETMDSPMRRFFHSYLQKHLGDLNGKQIIEIGSGTGYLTGLYKELGARDLFGIEPAANNVRISEDLHPDMHVARSSLEDFVPHDHFDVAVSVMVFEHIADPKQAFKKIFDMLVPRGLFFLVVGDINYLTMPRFNYVITTQTLSHGELAIMTERPKRPQALMYDIARPLENYMDYAASAGFKVRKHISLLPTDELKARIPKFVDFQDIPIGHLLVLEK